MNLEKIASHLKKHCVIKALIIIAFYFIMMFIISDYIIQPLFIKIIENASGIKTSEMTDASLSNISALYNIIIYAVLFIPLFISYSFELSYDMYSFISIKPYRKQLLIFFGIFYIFTIIGSILSTIVYKDSSSVNQESINATIKNSSFGFVAMFITAVLVGPIVEELVFRQAFFDVFENKYLSIGISSLFFASIHVISSIGKSPLYMVSITIPYIASGLAFGIIYEKSHRNIWLSIIVHAATNAISLIIVMLA